MKVKIQFAVSEYGTWHAYGGLGVPEQEALNECLGNMEEDSARVVGVVEVDLPLPSPSVIQGVAIFNGVDP